MRAARSVLLVGILVWGFGLTPAWAARTTIPIPTHYYATVEEAARAIQENMGEIRVVKMLPSDKGGYDPVALPLQAFVLGPKTLTLKYQVPRMKEAYGLIHTRPLPVPFTTQTPELVEETLTIPLDRVRLANVLMTPDPPRDPTWGFWVVLPSGHPHAGPNTLAALSQPKAEILVNALRSLMAASGNPYLEKDKTPPPTLSFEKAAPVAAPKPQAPKLGFSVLPEAPPGQQGLKIVAVEQGSPAEKAGLLVGDVILEVNGTKVAKAGQLAAALDPQENLFAIERGGRTLKIRITPPVAF